MRIVRLIDADALIQSIQQWYCAPERCNSYNGVRCRACHIDDALTNIDSATEIEAVPLKPLAEWLAGYAAPPRNAMMKTLTPGGFINHDSLTEAWENTLREMRGVASRYGG